MLSINKPLKSTPSKRSAFEMKTYLTIVANCHVAMTCFSSN